MRKIAACVVAAVFCTTAWGQGTLLGTYRDSCKRLSSMIEERTGVRTDLKLRTLMRRSEVIDYYFTSTIGDIPWRSEDIPWLSKVLQSFAPEKYKGYRTGTVYCGKLPIRSLIINPISYDGKPVASKWTTTDPRITTRNNFVYNPKETHYGKGLSGRCIALWHSHGRYYDEHSDMWCWQRPPLFTTVEDLYTQSYVLPFLIPMLENAGAYVLTPRERDTQEWEVIADNDESFSHTREGMTRRLGEYQESGTWKDAGTGFADVKEIYTGNDNPFTEGTARSIACVRQHGGNAAATWTADIPERGRYAVYISYKSLENSTSAAHYTVQHAGGTTDFIVDQRKGGGTWIYLGTFEFLKGKSGQVVLDNGTYKGLPFHSGRVVSADAVRFGGGIGKIARGRTNRSKEEYTTSGLPSYMEGALYWMQWAGADSTVTRSHEGDYTNDYAGRGAWVSMMSASSRSNPKAEGKGIPVDLSLAFHSDAGMTPNDSTIGTLGIYTLYCNGSRKLPDGEDRMTCRMLTDNVQSQIVSDIRTDFDSTWRRRGIADRSYSESRTTSVPAMILELLSHQNFADMKYGLDPAFRFTVSRAVYKGILKYLSSRYGCHYAVQPLPVNSMSVSLSDGNKAKIMWKPTSDPIEPTAMPEGYILYTKVDDGAYDTGKIIKDAIPTDDWCNTEVQIWPGHIYEFKVAAYNSGGKSFTGESVAVGIPKNRNLAKTALVVNNFDRVAPPSWYDSPEYAGFDEVKDGGVPYMYDISRIGSMYLWQRNVPWTSDYTPGFGASFLNDAGKITAGNTFDYAAIHGKALMKYGYSFSSCSAKAFADRPALAEGSGLIDIICGKQGSTPRGKKGLVYQVFPSGLQKAIKDMAESGTDIIVSGANIGTDLWDCIYPVKPDSVYQAEAQKFAKEVLGYQYAGGNATKTSNVIRADRNANGIEPFSFNMSRNSSIYCIEAADGIVPSGRSSHAFLRYEDSGIPCGIFNDGESYRSASISFPIEVIDSEKAIEKLIETIVAYFDKP